MIFYRPPTKLEEGNIFTGVCRSFSPWREGEWVGISGPMSFLGGISGTRSLLGGISGTRSLLGGGWDVQGDFPFTYPGVGYVQGVEMSKGWVCPGGGYVGGWVCPKYLPCSSLDNGIWLASGRYASYWNAFLFLHINLNVTNSGKKTRRQNCPIVT